jgi:hypothetical protein
MSAGSDLKPIRSKKRSVGYQEALHIAGGLDSKNEGPWHVWVLGPSLTEVSISYIPLASMVALSQEHFSGYLDFRSEQQGDKEKAWGERYRTA